VDNRLQGGNYLPRWSSRAWVGLYLGMLPQHARSVALVLNLTTGLVSPQFHVEFDDLFETVSQRSGNRKVDSQWQVLSGLRAAPKNAPISVTPPGSEGVAVELIPDTSDIPPTEVIPEVGDQVFPSDDREQTPDLIPDQPVVPEETADDLSDMPELRRRSGRARVPTQRMLESIEQENIALAFQLDETMERELQLQDDMMDPIAFAASADPDNMYLHEAMKAPDKRQFMKAMVKEVSSHQDNDHWLLMKRTAIPAGKKVLPAVWAMKRKRRIAT
jgi:hypothetical protein